jgi:hypothetical protein
MCDKTKLSAPDACRHPGLFGKESWGLNYGQRKESLKTFIIKGQDLAP